MYAICLNMLRVCVCMSYINDHPLVIFTICPRIYLVNQNMLIECYPLYTNFEFRLVLNSLRYKITTVITKQNLFIYCCLSLS